MPAHVPYHVEVTLDKENDDEKLGMRFIQSMGKIREGLFVKAILSAGLVPAYNARHIHMPPTSRVRAGDIVTKVNGVSKDCPSMVAELEKCLAGKVQSFSMTLRKQTVPEAKEIYPWSRLRVDEKAEEEKTEEVEEKAETGSDWKQQYYVRTRSIKPPVPIHEPRAKLWTMDDPVWTECA